MPVDFSAAAGAAVAHAADLARRYEAEVILLHVIAPAESLDTARTTTEAKRMLAEFCEDQGVDAVHCKQTVRSGIPFVEITQTADSAGADLIVLGRRHVDSSVEWANGHTSERVVRYAKCPVLLVREPAAPAVQS